MTWYLKYRPRKLAELDIKAVREALTNILSAENIPHAFLLLGPRGLGKTSAARIIAKSVNCPGTKSGEPCGECETCRLIADGLCPDVVEIDAASNRGIDDVREIRERAKLAPLMAVKKVYVVDEAHMLTVEAANALLKILEEPPPNTMFILCTTEAHKIPQTVASRCMVLQFNQPTQADLVDKLRAICGREKLSFTDRDLEGIARLAKGSFRDAIKLLEQAALSGTGVDALAGLSDVSAEEFLRAVESGDRGQALKHVDEIVKQGGAITIFIEQCMWVLRDRLLSSRVEEKVVLMLESLTDVYVQTKLAAVVQLPLEIWVVKNTPERGSGRPEPEAGGDVAGSDGSSLVGVQDEVRQVSSAWETKLEAEVKAPAGADWSDIKAVGEQLIAPSGRDRLADLLPVWPEVLRVVKRQNNSVEALLKSTRPVRFEDEQLWLEVFYAFHKDKLDSEKCRGLVEAALWQVTGQKVRLKLTMSSKKTTVSEVSGAVEEDIVAAAAEIFKVEAI